MSTLFALDVSNTNPANAAEVKESGCKLLICKATEGSSYQDPTLAEHREIARKLGIRFGSYLFLHTRSSGSEAGEYLRYAKPARGELVIIDAESGGQDGASIAALARRAHSCAVALQTKGFNPILYASASTWKQMIAAEPALKPLRVWEAQYPGIFTRWLPTLSRLRIRLGRGVTVVMWQWTDRFKVGPRYFDASRIFVPVDKL